MMLVYIFHLLRKVQKGGKYILRQRKGVSTEGVSEQLTM